MVRCHVLVGCNPAAAVLRKTVGMRTATVLLGLGHNAATTAVMSWSNISVIRRKRRYSVLLVFSSVNSLHRPFRDRGPCFAYCFKQLIVR